MSEEKPEWLKLLQSYKYSLITKHDINNLLELKELLRQEIVSISRETSANGISKHYK